MIFQPSYKYGKIPADKNVIKKTILFCKILLSIFAHASVA